VFVSGGGSCNQGTIIRPQDSAYLPSLNEQITLRIFPNPSPTEFNLIPSNYFTDIPMTLRVIDGLGRLVEVYNNVLSGEVINLGAHYKSGVYFAEIIQGRNRVVKKLVKL
jgi:hypothetical protein